MSPTRLLPLLFLAGTFQLASAAPRAGAPQRPVAKQTTRARAAQTARPARKATAPIKLTGDLSPAEAHARNMKLAQAYATQHDYPVRTVEAGPEGRKIQRVFVPILGATKDAFEQMFTAEGPGKSVILRHTPSNQHVAMVVKPGDTYLWGKNYNGEFPANGDYRHLYAQFDDTRSTWPGASVTIHPTNVTALKAFLKKKEAEPRCEGHCMMWLTNAPVGKDGEDRALFHDLGLKRSRDGDNMHAKIMHAGNHRVGVIGVHVRSVDEFNNMTAEQLLGRLPQGGIEAAMRE